MYGTPQVHHHNGRCVPPRHGQSTLKVPSVYRGLRLIYTYDDGFHDDFNVSEELDIKYYD